MGRSLSLSAELNRAETVETAVTRAMELVETAFDRPAASVCAHDPATGTVTTLGSSVSSSAWVESAPDRIPELLVDRAAERGEDASDRDASRATVDTSPWGPIQVEVLVPVGRDRALRVGATEQERLDSGEIAIIKGIAANLEATLARIDHRQSAAVGSDVARALFAQSDEATFVSDTDGALVAVNRAAVELTGRERDAVSRGRLPDIFGDTAAESVRSHLDETLTGVSEPFTTTLEHAHEGTLTVELTSKRVDVDGTSYIRTTAHERSSGEEGGVNDPVEDDATALRRLSELTAGIEEFDETIERLLSLGCEHFGLDTGILSHIDGDEYEVDTVVDATGTHEAGAVYELGNTMCDVTLARDATESLAFADVGETDHENHPAAESVRAYIAAPVIVDDETYGTLNFSMGRPRAEAFRPEEREFVTLVAEWVGTEIERRHRFEELERYETILEAIDDPVYALDARVDSPTSTMQQNGSSDTETSSSESVHRSGWRSRTWNRFENRSRV
ncbi:MAG: GAF domain protein [halophilic archaeon J07HX64]|nr:MAG: GAF domain protein [halophilic archaeon J07HX64]